MQVVNADESVAELRNLAVFLVKPDGSDQDSTSGLTITFRRADGSGGGEITKTLTAVGSGTGRYVMAIAQADCVEGIGWISVTGASIQTFKEPVLFRRNVSFLSTAQLAAIAAAGWDLTSLASHRVSGSFGELVQLTIGLLNGNSMIDNVTYGANNVMTSARRRVFADATALGAAVAGHANNADGEIFRFTITAVDAGDGQFSSYKETRTL